MVICPFTVPHVAMPSIEAGFLGKPVVISENGHARETVLDKKTGLIVPSNDAEALAAAINKLLDNPEKAEVFGRNGKSHIDFLCNKAVAQDLMLEQFLS